MVVLAFHPLATSTMGKLLPEVRAGSNLLGSILLISLNFTAKTGRWNGVVTAFITMSDIKDEIDWEFPGANTTQGQTNFFWQGAIRSYISFYSSHIN